MQDGWRADVFAWDPHACDRSHDCTGEGGGGGGSLPVSGSWPAAVQHAVDPRAQAPVSEPGPGALSGASRIGSPSFRQLSGGPPAGGSGVSSAAVAELQQAHASVKASAVVPGPSGHAAGAWDMGLCTGTPISHGVTSAAAHDWSPRIPAHRQGGGLVLDGPSPRWGGGGCVHASPAPWGAACCEGGVSAVLRCPGQAAVHMHAPAGLPAREMPGVMQLPGRAELGGGGCGHGHGAASFPHATNGAEPASATVTVAADRFPDGVGHAGHAEAGGTLAQRDPMSAAGRVGVGTHPPGPAAALLPVADNAGMHDQHARQGSHGAVEGGPAVSAEVMAASAGAHGYGPGCLGADAAVVVVHPGEGERSMPGVPTGMMGGPPLGPGARACGSVPGAAYPSLNPGHANALNPAILATCYDCKPGHSGGGCSADLHAANPVEAHSARADDASVSGALPPHTGGVAGPPQQGAGAAQGATSVQALTRDQETRSGVRWGPSSGGSAGSVRECSSAHSRSWTHPGSADSLAGSAADARPARGMPRNDDPQAGVQAQVHAGEDGPERPAWTASEWQGPWSAGDGRGGGRAGMCASGPGGIVGAGSAGSGGSGDMHGHRVPDARGCSMVADAEAGWSEGDASVEGEDSWRGDVRGPSGGAERRSGSGSDAGAAGAPRFVWP